MIRKGSFLKPAWLLMRAFADCCYSVFSGHAVFGMRLHNGVKK